VHAMPPCSCVDLATRAEKCGLHRARESFPSVMRSTREHFRSQFARSKSNAWTHREVARTGAGVYALGSNF
jgi:hypothetical protein